MTGTPAQAARDQLTEHRLAALEEVAVGARQVERDTDHLKLSVTHIEQTLTEFKTEVRERDKHTSDSLKRLHERLDDLVTGEARDEGERIASVRMWKVVGVAIGASTSVAGVIVAVLALLLQ